ncbi:hypothetical protein ACROYT_G012415 [Oculina patagonica]
MAQHGQEHEELHSSASKLKVTILASEWGSSKGGLSTINRELAIQLAKCPEVEITFFVPHCSEEDKRAALSLNIKIVEATSWPGYEELEWLSFPPDDLQIDVIVGHGVKLGRQAQVIRKSHKCKWVQVVHTDPEELGMYKSYQNPISTGEKKHKTEVELCEKADFVVGVGPKLSEAFRSYLRWCKKDQTILDFTPGVFNDFVNVEHAVEERKRCGVLVFGRGDAEDFQLKGFDIAGKAVAQLKDAHLVFVGAPEGKHEDIAKFLLECGIPASRLTVRSFLQCREDLKRLFCEVDLVLMPSRTEGFGLTGLEALSAGLPVLVSKNSGFGEALHKVPFGLSCVIDSEDAKVWAEAINGIWNKDRETRLQEAEVLRSSYEKKYSWAKQSQGLVTKMASIVQDCQSSSHTKSGLSVSPTTEGTQRTTADHEQYAGSVPKLTSTKEESNYARLCQLLVTMGSRVLKETFDRIIPPQNLQKHLKGFRVHETLQSLRKQGILSSKQWGQLYPAHASSVSSKDFDPTLLMVLLRTVCELTPPTAGWDAPPLTADSSREADIARVRYFINTVFGHADKASVSDVVFLNYCENIREVLVRLGGTGYGDAVDEMKNQNMDPLNEEHYKELFKQWKKDEDCIKDKMNELESVMEASGEEDISCPSHVIERIRQLYKTREDRLMPVPWCEGFSFHLDDIFTRLKIVNKDKTRGTLTEEITNMTAIFKAHEGCQKPRTVLIEGDPGKGKTTYCQKLAYDWANRQEEWDESFLEIELLLLLRCHDIKSNIWEAIEEQILPEDIGEETKQNFFKFIRENQSKVLLVLDGLDEADPSTLSMYIKLAESRELPKCHIVFTSRHETGMKVRRYCDTLWEIVGFSEDDANSFIVKYFKDNEHLADRLLEELSPWYGSSDLREMTSNPLNTALLCVLCEDFEGDLPTSRTQLYIEIVLCVLRRYENKRDLSRDNKDLINVYKEELIHLGYMALISLRNGELYIEESESSSNSTALSKFGFLSVQAAGSRRKPCLRYGFLHKSFQEFLAGFYLASMILSGEIDLDTVVADKRYLNELKQVFLFMGGIIVSQCEETAVRLVKSITAHINCLDRSTPNGENEINDNVKFAFDCIKECVTCQENLQRRLVCTFGSHLDLQTLELLDGLDSHYIEYFAEALAVNNKLTSLRLSENEIDPFGAGLVSDALAVNTTLTTLDLSGNKIGPSGAGSLSKALAVNTTLTDLNLKFNAIGNSGADSLFQALLVNTTLTSLSLRANNIDVSCVDSLSEAFTANVTLTYLDLGGNWLGRKLAAGFSLSKALEANTALTKLDLSNCHRVRSPVVASISDALTINNTITYLNLRGDGLCDSGAGSLSDSLRVNTTLTHLNLSENRIGDSGAGSLSDALIVNTTLTNLNLGVNEIGDYGAGFLSEALTVNTTLTNLNLAANNIVDSGASSLSDALTVNTTLTELNLNYNEIGVSGAGALSTALTLNTTLTHLDLSENRIGDSGAGVLSEALTVNTTLTHLNLSQNRIGDSGAGSLSETLTVNTTLTELNLKKNKIGDSGAGSLSKALTVNTTLTIWI